MRIGNTELQPLTKNLLFINVLLYLATFIFKNKFNVDLSDFLAARFPLLVSFQPFQLLSHMFMHGSTMHLFFNMFGLFMFGNFLEKVIGTKKFALLYFISGFGAIGLDLLIRYYNYHELSETIASLKDQYPQLLDAKSYINTDIINRKGYLIEDTLKQVPRENVETIVDHWLGIIGSLVGASGCIYGLLAAFAYLFPNTELMLLFIPFPIKAKFFVPIMVGIDLFLGVNPIGGSNIAHFAHVGGALFGLLLVIFWNKYNKRDFY